MSDAPTAEDYPGTDPVGLVLSKNLHRRHLTASQRAGIVVACAAWAESGSNQHTPKGGGEPGALPPQTVAEAAKAAGVSERTVQQAKAAEDAGLGDAVRDGKVSVKQAAEAAKLPPEQRAAAIDNPPKPPKKKKAPKQPNKNEQELAERVADLTLEVDRLNTEINKTNIRLKDEAVITCLEGEPAKEIINLGLKLRAAEIARDDMIRENAELMKQVKRLQVKLDILEKKAAQVAELTLPKGAVHVAQVAEQSERNQLSPAAELFEGGGLR